MKTRTKKVTGSENEEIKATATAQSALAPSVIDPPQVFILPKDTSDNARILTLPNPATSAPARYLICPQKGFYEFTRVAARPKSCRSWLLASHVEPEAVSITTSSRADNPQPDKTGYVLQSPDLMIATPVDPLFFLLPVLSEGLREGSRQMYLPTSDYLDKLVERSPHLGRVIRRDDARLLEQSFERRMEAMCDTVDAGDDKMHRLNMSKLLTELLAKAESAVQHGLPPSMAERFVTQTLTTPVVSIRREESAISMTDGPKAAAGVSNETDAYSQESQTSLTTTKSTTGISTTAIAFPSVLDVEESRHDVAQLLRLRTALDFILDLYVPYKLRQEMSSDAANLAIFAPLIQHLEALAKAKREVQALRSLSDNISRKRSAADDGEALEKAEAKRRKKEEEEMRRKNQSKGVKQLAKADTSGMKKLSSFFTKPAAVKNS